MQLPAVPPAALSTVGIQSTAWINLVKNKIVLKNFQRLMMVHLNKENKKISFNKTSIFFSENSVDKNEMIHYIKLLELISKL